jgi:hypothetical protein
VLQEAAKAATPGEGDFATVYEGADTSYEVSGQGASRYHYRVKAHSGAGDSSWSTVRLIDVLWEAEPNDDALTEANGPIVSDLTYRGTFPDPAEFDKDYFTFQLLNFHTVDVWLTNIASGQDYDIALRNADLEEIARSDDWGQVDERISTGVLSPGRYYVQVYHYDSGGSTEPYHLRVAYEEDPEPDVTPCYAPP